MASLTTSTVIEAITGHAYDTPSKTALQGATSSLNYADLASAIEQMAIKLQSSPHKVLAVAIDNSIAWAIIDLAAMQLNLPTVPLPYFFSSEQILHALNDATVDVLLTDQPHLFEQLLNEHGKRIIRKIQYSVSDKIITQLDLSINNTSAVPENTAKITYTSGTTGKPKGVCLDSKSLQQVALSLLNASNASTADTHLSILPLSTLLENIAGLYVPLMAGATTTLLSADKVGLSGASGLNIAMMMEAFATAKATTTVLTPELLNGLISAIEAGYSKPTYLRFVAVGGASVAPQLLSRSAQIGLPVYEGYGLSECASVVALNTPNHHKAGSVGKPLAHAQIKFAEDGEILVKGACLLGYANATLSTNEIQNRPYWPTGDIGHFDDEGYLYITARKKNQFITSFGRNVAPEWVERELTLAPTIIQAAVFGEAKPWNVAIILPAKNASAADIDSSIAEINQSLPDYARVKQWLPADAPFSPKNDQLTANGRLRRNEIWQNYQARINEKYEDQAYEVL